MTRAALLPAGSDPFLLAYWLRNFATWSKSVDQLVVSISGKLEPEAQAYIESLIAATPGASVHFFDHRTLHGDQMAFLVGQTDATHVMFCEDDAFVRSPEVIEECFLTAEAGGIAATPRGGYASEEVTQAAGKALGANHSYWPCFVFVAREHLLATDLRFGSTAWDVGDMVLGTRMREPSVSDTFVWGSYQLRALGLEEDLRDNHRLSGQWVPDNAPWFHVGSLSSGHGYGFMGMDTESKQYRDEVAIFRILPAGNAAQRMAWWWRFWHYWDGSIPEYHARYGEELERFRDDCGVPKQDIEASRLFDNHWITWYEVPENRR